MPRGAPTGSGVIFCMELITTLRERIDRITREIISKYSVAFGESHVATKEQMWRCGLEVLKDYPELEDDKPQRGGRGVVAVSFKSVAREIERADITIKRWVELVKEIGKTENEWVIWSDGERQRAIEKYTQGMLTDSTAHVGYNSGDNEWYTPPEYIEAARAVMGDIDLDPASTPEANEIVQAKKIFTEAEDGRMQEWNGRVWMNPPYSYEYISDFCEKLSDEFSVGRITEACVLVNNATETYWFQGLCQFAQAICFPAKRIKFWHPAKEEKASPLQGQAVLYFGDNVDLFMDAFRRFGVMCNVG